MLLFFFTAGAHAQVMLWSVRGGPTVATQKWDNFERDPLVGYHGAVQLENYSETNLRSLYAQLGYHLRGSAIRTRAGRFTNPTTGRRVIVDSRTIPFKFHNLALSVGGKQHYMLGTVLEGFVGFGLRGEYSLATSLKPSEENQNFGFGSIYPLEEFANKFLYGIDVVGGVSMPLTDSFEGLVELRVSPDLSRQYFQPPLRNIYNPVTGNLTNIAERRITNLSFELSLGLRFLPAVDEPEL